MASRSKASSRRERDSDTGESLKPLVVLVLLGTILYGAWTLVSKGPGGTAAGPAEPLRADLASAPAFAPQVEMPAAPAQPAATTNQLTPPLAADTAGLPAASSPPAAAATGGPTYLNAVSAPPPVAERGFPAETAPATAAAALAAAAATTPPPADMPPASGFDAPRSPQQAPPASGYALEATPSAAFASSWADAHDKLAAGRYAEALAVLSTWHDDPALGLEESQRLEDLLGQLAGTVIWSQKDLLFPSHIVQEGETLQSIAAPLAVSWQLLAKINGVADPARLVPGESLKLVRGPFDAVVSVSRRRLSLRLAGSYAGSFPVVVGRQLRERVGTALPVVAINEGGAAAEQPGAATQVAWAQPAPKTIALADGITIEGVADPATVSDAAIPTTSLIVADRDLLELADILGPGSQVIVRQ
ncbi:MAG: LysM peptidoglycan-binding domain-containing protein [Planctomycetia bacterium]